MNWLTKSIVAGAVAVSWTPAAAAETWDELCASTSGLSAVLKYECYFRDASCKAADDDKCLELTSYVATRASGRRVQVYGVVRYRDGGQWYDATDPDADYALLSHFTLTYMRKLRNAYAEAPHLYRGRLYDQIDFLVSDGRIRHGALVWENKHGYAHGMEQAELAAFLASAAVAYASNGDGVLAKGTMRYALQAAASLGIDVGPGTGGVRSPGRHDCAVKRARLRPCTWFHSRGRGVVQEARPYTVLNQHLHVVRDALELYQTLYGSQDLVPSDMGTAADWLRMIEDAAIGGLYQLAYSPGNAPGYRNRPPNIAQFMNHNVGTISDGRNPMPYYWAYYEFLMTHGEGKDISLQNTCGYHFQVLDLMKGIWTVLNPPSPEAPFPASPDHGWRLYEAVESLLDHGGYEERGIVPSSNAIYQFFRSADSPAIRERRQGCAPLDLPPEEQPFLSADWYLHYYY